MANITFNATMSWSGQGVYCEGGARGFAIAVDEPAELGGSNRAMNPVELLLCALGGCMSICASAFAKGCKVDLKGFKVELSGDLDPDGFLGKSASVRKGYQEIRYKMIVDSPSPKEDVDKLIAMIEERCPVSDTLCGVRVRRV
ncbi:MAG: OsmC family protein [Clostridia bacterium]|nr:OsmC family protein [Clostridia bacterium]